MLEASVAIVNERGMHARAAARFVHLAGSFESAIRVCTGIEEADGKSILSLLVLGAARGTQITVRVDGPDEAAALEALLGLVGSGFDERT